LEADRSEVLSRAINKVALVRERRRQQNRLDPTPNRSTPASAADSFVSPIEGLDEVATDFKKV